MDANHSNEFVSAVHAAWRTAWRPTRSFRLWREPCRRPPSPIRERGYSAARRRAPSDGSRSTTWTTASRRSARARRRKFRCFQMCFCALQSGMCVSRRAPAVHRPQCLLSLLQGLETTGALDLGGASTQISFVSDNYDGSESPSNSVTFRLYGNDYNLYTHSFLCYGKDQVLRMMLAHQTQVNF